MTGAPAIVWFRRDLRLADNPALRAAIESGAPVLPVFIWSPEEDAPWQPGAASRWWLHHSLEALGASLRQLGSNLIIRRGPTTQALLKLSAETGAGSIRWNGLYEPTAISRDAHVETELRHRGIGVEIFSGHLLFDPGSIRNQTGQPFKVFTAFWKSCLQAPAPPRPAPAPTRISSPKEQSQSPAVSDLRLEPSIDWAQGLRETWTPGESTAAAQLHKFLTQGVADYQVERDRPDHAGTSRLSPHLHFGEISPRQIWHAAHHSGDTYLRQLIWREFAHHLLVHFPHTPQQPLRPEFARFPWRLDERLFAAWTQGATGYPLVDAGMRELWHTGWMHNRVRMVAASFLVKHLLISWQEGAAWFWDTLVDADLANNTLGWQWVAGCGADAAPYFRIFNPTLQAAKFDPESAYIKRWIPESENAYFEPVVNHAEARGRALAAFAKIRI